MIARSPRSAIPIVVSGLLGILLLQCRVDERIAYEQPDVPPELITPATIGDAGPAGYCPSSRCPEAYTTCSGSRFACDVNLKTDPNNCGACGVQCPSTPRPPGGVSGGPPQESAPTWSCVEGRCALVCRTGLAMDCDGLVDNGCETLPSENDNCGSCGNVCPAGKPCSVQPMGGWGCGCPQGFGACNFGACTSLADDDFNCGACNNACNPSGDGGAPPPNARYGCAGGKCGALKCNDAMGNCDGDPSTGCETPLTTNDNCGACGNACAAGESCLYDRTVKGFRCLCPPGLTYCNQECVDLSSNDLHCGTCGNVCGAAGARVHLGSCSYGKCVFSCTTGSADCNGNPQDGCEVDTMSDPQNCGGCGITCDGIAGQACAGGRCVVEPCGSDGGVGAR